MSPARRHLPMALAMAAAALAATATKIRSNDLWWHLASGRWILENGTVPRSDPFSFTSSGVAWLDHGWLWQLCAVALESAFGVPALVALKMAAATVFALAAWAVLRRSGWGSHLSAVLVLVCLAGSRFRFADRPEAAGLALLSLFLYFLVARETGRLTRLAGAAGVTLVWASVHASVLIAPVFALAAGAGSALAAILVTARGEGGAAPHRRRAVDHLLTAVVSGGALLVNPYGVRLVLVPFQLEAVLARGGFINPEWPPPPLRLFPLFWSALVVVLVVAALRVARRADPSTWRGLLLVGAAAYLATSSIRHVGLFFVALPFAAAAAGLPGLRARSAGAPRRALFSLIPDGWAPAWPGVAALLFLLVPGASVGPRGFGVVEGRFPVDEVGWVRERMEPPRRLYNDVAHGGYLIHQLFPEDQVFIDGRNEVHAELLSETADAVDDGLEWQEMLDRHGIQSALVRYRPGKILVGGQARAFAPLHFPGQLWALVHWGDGGMVYVKRGGRFDGLIDRFEYASIQPEDWEFQLQRCREGDDDLKEALLGDLRRRLSEEPPSTRAFRIYQELQGLSAE